jgi:hypothetical protein
MTTLRYFAPLLLSLGALAGCGSTGQEPVVPPPGQVIKSVVGKMSFVLGGTSGAGSSSLTLPGGAAQQPPQVAPLGAGDGYIVSPRKAKITFTSVVFRGSAGETLGTSDFTSCIVTYDRSLAAGSTLLDCPFTAPVGDIYQIAVYFDKTLQLLVSDAATGIYSDPQSATGFSTTAGASANYVPFKITIGDNTSSRATPIIFSSPVAIVAGSSPTLYITTDMIQTLQVTVNQGGTTLTADGLNNDPVALFGGITRGSSVYYSNANAVESYKLGSVNDFRALRIFYDQAGLPLYMIAPNTCGIEGPKGAWASPPIGATIGGWLGKDANRNLAWALPVTSSYATYSAYFVMAEQTVIGQTTTLKCKATASPPAPADGKTYASGAPAMASPDKSTTLTLVAK